MKKLAFPTPAGAAVLFLLSIPALAKAPKDPAKAEQKILRKAAALYDTNGNGSLEGEEVAAIKKAFEADKTGLLKSADTNADGLLDDAEIAALHPKVKLPKKAKKA